MKLALIALVVLVIISAGVLWELPGSEKKEKFTLSKFMNSYDINTHTFKTHLEGENITIQDGIKEIRYDRDLNRTLIIFNSMRTKPLAFTGENGTNDLTSNYFLEPGDSVTVDIHIHRFSNGEETLEEWMYELKKED